MSVGTSVGNAVPNAAGSPDSSTSPNTAAVPLVDLAIVGGGMVGACLALALADTLKGTGRRLVLLEATPPDTGQSPSFDGRTSALSNGSRRILTTLGVWEAVVAQAAPISRIHISDRGHFGAARIDAAEQGLEAMGYVVPNRVLGAALWARLQDHPSVELRAPCRVIGLARESHCVHLALDAGTTLAARLVVAADGAQSVVRAAAGVSATADDYGQVALITQVSAGKPHAGVAYERFTTSGPIAVLPLPPAMGQQRVATVWTLAPAAAARVRALDDAAFLSELQQAFGWRLGRLSAPGERLAYPLALVQAASLVSERVAIIGNAAQGLHPIAGQGFNLGLRDAVTLAECVADGFALPDGDPGSAAVLQRYAQWRAADRRLLVRFTDGLVKLFGTNLGPLRAARSLGLSLFDVLPPAKAALSTLSTGGGGDLPRLARGLCLRGPLPAALEPGP
jgi:2-octaprenyl-6-methoxyphenol hydroxylase